MLIYRFSKLSGRFEITGAKGSSEHTLGHFRPPVDISFIDGLITVRMDVPGITAENLSIEAGENEIGISGVMPNSETPGVCRLMERSSGNFLRVIKFPTGIESDKVRANLESGVLTIVLPAPDFKRDPTRIVIQLEGAD
ncbi:MAG TPA: Hsp20/alpha crystallin family protein [Firmicutes bacterium]|nr:Hsp20/alpha crystallin family protein [Bacillota bacterium]